MIRNRCPLALKSALFLLYCIGWFGSVIAQAADPKSGTSTLTIQEASTLRGLIYNGSLSTVPLDPPSGGRKAYIDEKIVELHKRKLIGTLKLLLDIVKGGRPSDAIKAAVTVDALELSLDAAAAASQIRDEMVDKVFKNISTTLRDRLILAIEEILTKAEEQVARPK